MIAKSPNISQDIDQLKKHTVSIDIVKNRTFLSKSNTPEYIYK